jgi:hypothetical protein
MYIVMLFLFKDYHRQRVVIAFTNFKPYIITAACHLTLSKTDGEQGFGISSDNIYVVASNAMAKGHNSTMKPSPKC